MRRVFWGSILFLLLVLGGLWMYRRFISPPRTSHLWRNLPEGFSVVVYTPSFVRTWKDLRHSPLWTIWAQSPHFQSTFFEAQQWDSLLHTYPQLFEWLGNRGVVLSLYPQGPLYLMEAPFLAQIGDWRGAMQSLIDKYKWPIRLIEKEGYGLWQLPEGFLAPAGQVLVYSPDPTLIVRFLQGESIARPPWKWEEEGWGDSKPWLAIGWQGPALAKQLNHPAWDFLQKLPWGDLRLTLTEEGLSAQGTWYPDSSFWLHISPTSPSVAGICPPSTQILFTFRLQDPVAFYRQHMYPKYEKEINQAEHWLSSSFEKDFFAHLSGEIGLVQAEAPFLLLRLKDPEAFSADLGKLERRLRNRTPLRTREIAYRGYKLHYAEVKGLFRWLLGRLFEGWESPYWVQIGEWIAISRSPAALRSWIDTYLSQKSIYERSDFNTTLLTVPEKPLFLGYVAPNPATWMNYWVTSPSALERWKKELAPWQQAYFTLAASKTQGLSFTMQIFWQSNAPSTSSESSLSVPTPTSPSVSQDSSIEGLQEEYYPNGVLKRRATFIEGLLEGEYWEYHPNGMVKVQGYYEQGQKVGRWRYYNARGELLREENWGGEENLTDTASGL